MAVQAQYTHYIFHNQQQQEEMDPTLSSSRKRKREAEFLIPSTSGQPILSYPDMELDPILRLHSAKLRAGLVEIHTKQCRQIVSMLENQAAKKLHEKETQIANEKRRQLELEIKLRQLMSENQMWYTVAKNSEGVIAGLKENLDQVLCEGHVAEAEEQEEEVGYHDAESCCYEGGQQRERAGVMCRVCGENQVLVLVLPCQHLCLCRDCNPITDNCPVCQGHKDVGLEVLLV